MPTIRAFLDMKGITPTLIFAGAHKVDGNPFEPLSPGVRDDLQAEVDNFYSLFVQDGGGGPQGAFTVRDPRHRGQNLSRQGCDRQGLG
jgi:hypothetical protein